MLVNEKASILRPLKMTLVTQIQLLFSVSRPLSWIIAPSIWFSGLVHSGMYAWEVPGILFAIGLSFPTCLSENYSCVGPLMLRYLTQREVTFGVNDVYDYNSDVQNKRKNNRWADGTVLDPAHHSFVLSAARISTASVVLLGLPAFIRSPQLLGYTIAFVCLIWTYSSPPFRLKERPILDSLSNGAICWFFWACGYTFNGDATLFFDTKPTVRNGWLVLLYAMALHSLAAMLDARTDASAKYQTTATVLGERFAAVFSMVCL
jgi:4-hydroxybenzoate polyprenyltransferase